MGDYLKHVLDQHTTPENCPYPCNYCGRGYKNRRVLALHEAGHLAKKQFQCQLCPYNASRKDLLKGHVKGVHDNERPEICNICGKRFLTRTKLEKHILTHSDIKRYSCDRCGTKLK